MVGGCIGHEDDEEPGVDAELNAVAEMVVVEVDVKRQLVLNSMRKTCWSKVERGVGKLIEEGELFG